MERKSLLLWYTGDEPDGQVDPLNATKLTYDLVKSLDPYHPVSLCLNCLNYHFEEYTLGADIIMSDPYPIAGMCFNFTSDDYQLQITNLRLCSEHLVVAPIRYNLQYNLRMLWMRWLRRRI